MVVGGGHCEPCDSACRVQAMKTIIAILLIAFVLHSDAGAFSHGKAIQLSGADLISGGGDNLTSGGGDQLVSQ